MDKKLKCSSCNEYKSILDFYKDNSTKNGYSHKCKICKRNGFKSSKKKIILENKKFCNRCDTYKEFNNFSYCDSCSSKLRTYCKKCESNIYIENIDKIRETQRNYTIKNREKILKNKREYYLNNKDKRKIYLKNRLKNDKLFSLKNSISKNINLKLRRFLKYKKEMKTLDILGCSYEYFYDYIESKFEKWMTWDNRGLYNGEFNYGWDLDHIIPLDSAKNDEDVYKLNHYTNFQPLCSKVNRDIKWKN